MAVGDGQGDPERDDVSAADSDGLRVLTALQRGVWLEYRLDPLNPKYNTATGCRIRGALVPERMIAAWDGLVARHAQLRAHFQADATGPFYVVHEVGTPGARAPSRVLDASALSFEAAGALARREAAMPFDLAHEVGERLILVRRADDDWLLVVVIHHLVCDLASADIVLDELSSGYAARAAGESLSLLPPAHSYDEFAPHYEAFLRSEAGLAQAQYWQRTLEGAPTELALPVDHAPRPGPKIGASYPWKVLDREATAALASTAAALDTSLFRLLLAVFDTLLFRMTGVQDLLVSTAVDCRPPPFADVVGHFVNMIVVRTQLSPETTFRELIVQVRDRVKEGIRNKEYPFASVVRAASPERAHALGRTSFALLRLRRRAEFSGMMLSQAPSPWRATFGGMPVEPGPPLPQQEGIHDLTLWMAEVEGVLVAEMKYDTRLFDRATIERLATDFGALLRSAVASVDSPLSTLALVEPAERSRILTEFNRTTVTHPPFSGAEAPIRAWAARTPDRVALRHEDRALTYAQLEERVTLIAAHLQTAGVKPGSIVGIFLPRSLDTVAAMLAVLRCGGAFMPLDTSYPAERLAFMIDDSRPALIVTIGEHESFLPHGQARLAIDTLAPVPEHVPAASGVVLDSPAYVIYTSGSSGTPKGVVLHQGGLCNLAWGLRDAWEINEQSHVLCFATFNFDGAVASVFPALFAGAGVHLGDRDALHGGAALHALMATQAITHATLPPTIWNTLPGVSLPALTSAVSAGESCPPEIVAQWGRGRHFVNGYGPTETTVCATLADCVPGETVTIGRPFVNTRVYVLDSRREPVPIGARGEIFIGGAGVALGYLGREALTRERFIPNPFVEGDRLFCTGDEGRFLPDGRIVFLGRRDGQVKLRGLRIELGEIEYALRALPGVKDALAMIRTLPSGSSQLIAYVVAPAHQTSGLRGALARTLPDYMLPSHVVQVDAWPLTPNGKVDRRSLPAPPDAARPVEMSDATGDPSLLEEQVASVWRSLLGLSQLGRNESFFELGGDSLLALELAETLSRTLARDVPPSAIFEAPTLASLCVWLRRADAHAGCLVTLAVGAIEHAPLFCLHAAGGEALMYRPLDSRLTHPRPIIGVQSRALGDARSEHESIEAMAVDYAGKLERAQPTGAFHLLGWSMGGILAVAVAARLESRGRDVALVVVWDSHLASTFGAKGTAFAKLAPALGPLAGTLFERLSPSELDEFALVLSDVEPQLRRDCALERLARAGVDPLQLAALDARSPLHLAHHALLEHYSPPHICAPIHGWWADESLRDGRGPESWERFTSALSARTVVGNHFSILKGKGFEELAAGLDRALEELG